MATSAERFETVIVGGGAGGARDRLPPGEARAPVRDPRCERADRRPVAQALGLPQAVLTRGIRRAPGHALPGETGVLSDDARDGRLPRGVRKRTSSFRCAPARPWRRCRRTESGTCSPPASRRSRRTTSSSQRVSCRSRSSRASRRSSVRASGSSIRTTTGTSRSSRRAACSLSARATPEPTSPTRRRPSTRPSCRDRTRVRSRHRSRHGEDAPASAHCSSSGRTSSLRTRRSAARCARTSGTAALRSCATERRICCAAGVERVLARAVGVQDGLPVLDDGRVVDVQNVIWCTGFRRDFSWMRFPFEVDEDGYPVQYRGVVGSAPGLYFVGLLFLHSFTSMLIGGTGRDAERVAKHIATRPTRVEAPATPVAPIAEQVAS